VSAAIEPGLADPVGQAQQIFRAALHALAHPGRRTALPCAACVGGLAGGIAGLLLALADETTPVWWQPPLAAALADWLRFHTGAPRAEDPQQAAFAVVARPQALPALARFAAGTPAAPEFSTTLLIAVPSLSGGAELEWHGPGIAGALRVEVDGLAPSFWADWQANHAAFPQGVDALLVAGEALVGLPRTTRVRRLEAI